MRRSAILSVARTLKPLLWCGLLVWVLALAYAAPEDTLRSARAEQPGGESDAMRRQIVKLEMRVAELELQLRDLVEQAEPVGPPTNPMPLAREPGLSEGSVVTFGE